MKALFIGGPLDGQTCELTEEQEQTGFVRPPRPIDGKHFYQRLNVFTQLRNDHVETVLHGDGEVWAHNELTCTQIVQMLIDGYRQPADKPYHTISFSAPDPVHGPPPTQPTIEQLKQLNEMTDFPKPDIWDAIEAASTNKRMEKTEDVEFQYALLPGTLKSKPPRGLVPQRIWNEQRMANIEAAIKRYKEAGFDIPKEWEGELACLKSAEPMLELADALDATERAPLISLVAKWQDAIEAQNELREKNREIGMDAACRLHQSKAGQIAESMQSRLDELEFPGSIEPISGDDIPDGRDTTGKYDSHTPLNLANKFTESVNEFKRKVIEQLDEDPRLAGEIFEMQHMPNGDEYLFVGEYCVGMFQHKTHLTLHAGTISVCTWMPIEPAKRDKNGQLHCVADLDGMIVSKELADEHAPGDGETTEGEQSWRERPPML